MSQQQHDGDIAAAAPEPRTMEGPTLNLDDDPEALVDDSTERLPLTELAAGSEENAGENGETSEPQQGGTDGGDALKAKTMETFEIDQSLEGPSILQQVSQDMDDLDEEAQGLLSESPPPKLAGKTYCFCCGPTEEVGSSTIVCPGIYARSGWGIIGPHSFGPPCVVAVILSASYGFIHRGWTKVGPITGSICILWTLMICYHLINTAYRDPGIVREKNEQPTKAHRWCDLCQNFQPPGGAHCPDCNVCVAGFDHHCVWMGCCIGKSNMKQFTRFNLSWLTYLIYCCIWVSLVGPLIFRDKKK